MTKYNDGVPDLTGDSKGHYTMHMSCKNCGQIWRKDFEKGQSCKGSFECPTCGIRDSQATTLVKPYHTW